jgi:N-methylhydantoinase B
MAYDILIKNGRIVDGSGTASFHGDVAIKEPAAAGGHEGRSCDSWLQTAAGARVLPVLVTETITLKTGVTFRHVMSSGGGYGDPLERDPALVLRDVVQEKPSIAAALRDCGVVVDPAGPAMDESATAAIRTARRIGPGPSRHLPLAQGLTA